MSKRVIVDRQKLQNLITNNGMTNAEFSVSLGRDNTFITKVLRDENLTLSATDWLLIKSLYGVDVEYKEENNKPCEEETTQSINNLTPDEFQKLIYKAVYGAIKHAYEDRLAEKEERGVMLNE